MKIKFSRKKDFLKKGYNLKYLAIKEPLTHSPAQNQKALHEIEILKKLACEECPYTLKYYSSAQEKFPYKKRVMMDFFFDSESYSRHSARLAETLTFYKKIFFLTKVIQALHLFHRCGVYHMDVSFGNILISKSSTKIIDFGESYHQDLQKKSNHTIIENKALLQDSLCPLLHQNVLLLKNIHQSTTFILLCSSLGKLSFTAIPSTDLISSSMT